MRINMIKFIFQKLRSVLKRRCSRMQPSDLYSWTRIAPKIKKQIKITDCKYIYKYKAIRELKDIKRIEEIIKNKTIYIPTIAGINDPFEGIYIKDVPSVVGSGAREKIGIKLPQYEIELGKKRFLSFSKSCVIPQMWAHYANIYNGICFIYKNDNHFKDVIYYPPEEIQTQCVSIHNDYVLSEIIECSLLFKVNTWEYEQECRFITADSDVKFYELGDNLVGIILGHNLENSIANCIYDLAYKDGLQIYRTYVDKTNGTVRIIPYSIELFGNGEEIEKQVAEHCEDRYIDTFGNPCRRPSYSPTFL